MRTLAPNQTLDPARGSFLVRPRMVRELPSGQRIFVAPTEPHPTVPEMFETFSNSVEFKPVGGN